MTRTLGRLILRLFGWRVVGQVPSVPKYVLCSAPHTSNWDFLFCVATYWSVGVELHWVGKDSLFRGPLGWFMRATGGIPVDRSQANGMVRALADAFGARERLVVAMSTEGTRAKRDIWKSGFYHVARTANVPVVLGSLDYAKREAVLGPALDPSGDVRGFMDQIRAFYADKTGRHPEKFGRIYLKEEGEP
jgi:1-acyl-sn-glycerol-3-phosphate acyltransferase